MVDCLMAVKETLTSNSEVDFQSREEAAKYGKRCVWVWIVCDTFIDRLLDKKCLVGGKKIEMGVNETDDAKKVRQWSHPLSGGHNCFQISLEEKV